MATGGTVLCFGDSNTHGSLPVRFLGDRCRLGPDERWPGVCRAALGAGWTLIEEGHGGRTTVHDDPIEGVHKNGLAVLPAILETHRPLDIVVIMLGTNDLKARFSVTTADIAASVEKLVVATRQNGCGPEGKDPAILVVSPPKIIETGALAGMFEGGAPKSEGLAAAYADMAKRNNAAFFDAGSVIESDPLDGIHFGADAHATLGKAIAEKIRAL